MKISRYEVIREIGCGAMATVYLAHDPVFDRLVAIKILSYQLSRHPAFRMQFEREAKVIARLEHPFIVPVYDYGEHNGQLFIVMRYMAGGTLANWAAGKPRPLTEVFTIVERLASALDAIHRHGIVHRDLNPRNVLLDGNGFTFLADFGIAKSVRSSAMQTPTGIVGTPEYMSPEQAAGRQDLDGCSDVYSLGVMVYQLLSGELPYSAATPSSISCQHIHGPPPLLDVDRLSLPAECTAVMARALAKQPHARYASAGEFASALHASCAAPVPRDVSTLKSSSLVWAILSRLFRRKPKSFHTLWSWGDLEYFHPGYKRRKRALVIASIVVLPILIALVWWSRGVGPQNGGERTSVFMPTVTVFAISPAGGVPSAPTPTQAAIRNTTCIGSRIAKVASCATSAPQPAESFKQPLHDPHDKRVRMEN
jgi:serine/threonine protein kinase